MSLKYETEISQKPLEQGLCSA